MTSSMVNFMGLAAAGLGVLALAGCAPAAPKAEAADAAPSVHAASAIDAGRYLVVVGGCNDCHTPGWDMNSPNVPEAEWLTGLPVGWNGPWGTTYASNLRLVVDGQTEDEFVSVLHTRKNRPPMPWGNVSKLSDGDARAIYQFIKSLGPAGQPMPTALDPGVAPQTPFIVMAPPAMPTAG